MIRITSRLTIKESRNETEETKVVTKTMIKGIEVLVREEVLLVAVNKINRVEQGRAEEANKAEPVLTEVVNKVDLAVEAQEEGNKASLAEQIPAEAEQVLAVVDLNRTR